MKVYYIPNGTKNIATLFPLVDFDEVQKYYLEIQDGGLETIATTTINELDGECCQDKVRIHFLNYLGTFDTINFKKILEEHEAKSQTYQKPISYPLNKLHHGNSRYSVSANDRMTLSMSDYVERDLKWVKELVDSPLVFMEWKGIQDQDDAYIPLVIEDQKIVTLKQEDRYLYEVIITVVKSHDIIILRN